MADWKGMYLKMFRASEEAMKILEAAQLECEEMYMRDGDEEAEERDNMEDDYELEERADADECEADEEPDAPDNASA